ncbi:hypothetical protein HPB47_011552 [Ixodes persulcatus]|uniref:Uncharacterized protein n=2 Tax=Ixodes TaxID=6944 RepID=A0AC60NW29_IXOPE|nr:microtubule-associated proteins 1A/1B light chain 3C [Ixodes scapularis]KAG0411324.1 hypothetical protein HPB47_011552 [Ixodes persulcatus]
MSIWAWYRGLEEAPPTPCLCECDRLTRNRPIMYPNDVGRSFKERKSLAVRKEEVAGIRQRFPSKIPVIVERYNREKSLPLLDKTKFLVPQELTMSQFVSIVRNRLQISACHSFYLLVNNRSMANLSKTLSEVYAECHDEDGFLYVTYASQEMFGF